MDVSHEGVKDPMFYASHVESYCTLNDNCTSRSWSRFRRIYVSLVYLLFRHFRQTSYFTLHTIMSFTESENWLALFESVSRISKSKGAELDQESDEKPFTRAEISYLNKLLNSKLFETHDLDFEILRSDPNHPLHSVRTFQELNLKEPLLKGIAAMGFYKPSTIQERALSSLISDNPQNMIAQSQSGTGKTATFLLAMLSRISTDVHYCQCLCMAPTRELALQIESVGRQMAQFMTEVSFATAVRSPRVKVDSNGYVTDQIVIGTPGTIANWFRGTGEYRIDPSKVVMFVLDEADIMIEEEGFLNICMRVKKKLSRNCQILLFSATYEDSIIDFAHEFVPNPIEFRVKRTQLPLKNIKQFYMCFNDWIEKYQALKDIYGGFEVGQAIIFCATRQEASWLDGKMNLDGHKVYILSGDLDVSQREKVIEDFRSSNFRVLITTNVCSRGLDIPQVNLIINWNMPTTRTGSADWETYLHRIGRSGRFGKEGIAVNFIVNEEMYLLKELESHFG
ncbi:unnamed protein product [Schistosoma haematobium]|nr:unnamed protein product [Schistosoma haematobium]